MNAKHQKTLKAIFSSPVSNSLEWRKIESLMVATGCELIEGTGSRVAFKRDGLRADFHRPHPGKEARSYQVRAAREYLESLGVKP